MSALRESGYISQGRPQDVTPSFEFGLSDLCLLVKKCQKKEGGNGVDNEKALGLLSQC